jgi:enoyl-CoA hydratase/carnithine racemase
VVIATDAASFALPELLFGLVPAMALPTLLERLPLAKVRRLALCGLAQPPAEALALGLCDVVCERRLAGATVARWIRDLSRADPAAVGALKRFAREIARLDAGEALERGRALTGRLLGEPAVRERMRAFEAGEAPWSRR